MVWELSRNTNVSDLWGLERDVHAAALCVVQTAKSLPRDLKGCLATFGSSETVHRRLQGAVNEQIRGLRDILDSRHTIIAASEAMLRVIGIEPASRVWLVNLMWQQSIGH